MKKLFIPSIIVMGVSTLTPCLVACGNGKEDKIRTITVNNVSGTEDATFAVSKTSFTAEEMKKGFEIEIECTDHGSISIPIFWVNEIRAGKVLSLEKDYTVEYDQEVEYFGSKLKVKINPGTAISDLTIDVRIQEYSHIPIITWSNETEATLTVNPNEISDIRIANKYTISISEGDFTIQNVWLGYSETPGIVDPAHLETWDFRQDQHYNLTDVQEGSCKLNFTSLGVQILSTYQGYATEALVIEWSKK
mgnify:CR=1 FL=1